MGKGPAEVFGYPVKETPAEGEEAQERFWCPFLDEQCWKQSQGVSHPFGVCSVRYDDEAVAVCPSRLWQDRVVFKDVARHCFGSLDNLLVFSEVDVHGIGRLDHVIVKHKPLSSDVEDFVGVEMQTVDTTSTGGLVEAFRRYMAGEDISGENFTFGMNWANVWKRAFIQALMEGVVFEHWGKRLYYVAQEPAYRKLMARYSFHKLSDMSFNVQDSVVFMIYDLCEGESQYQLTRTRMESASVDEMLYAVKHGLKIPSQERFIRKLSRKAAEETSVRLRVEFERDG